MNVSYTDSVFINCPFDEDYVEHMQTIVFAVVRCGFVPRSALEESNALDTRIEKIVRLIHKCKYGIHDLSRTELDKTFQLPRFNMPFELGLFWGAKKFGGKLNKEKIGLVFEKDRNTCKKCLTDLDGVDITAHNGETGKIITAIRNFLYNASKRETIPSPAVITKDYLDFKNSRMPVMLQENDTSLAHLTFNDLCAFITAALAAKRQANK